MYHVELCLQIQTGHFAPTQERMKSENKKYPYCRMNIQFTFPPCLKFDFNLIKTWNKFVRLWIEQNYDTEKKQCQQGQLADDMVKILSQDCLTIG